MARNENERFWFLWWADFTYTQEQGRAVSVHPAGMLEALRKVYQAERVLAGIGH